MPEMDELQTYQRVFNSLTLPENLPVAQIHRLVQRGMLAELLADASPTAIGIIKQVVVTAALPLIQQAALEGLIGLAQSGHPSAILSLYELAIEYEHSGAIAALTDQRFQPEDPALLAVFAFLYLEFYDYTKLDLDNRLLADFLFRSEHSTGWISRLNKTVSTEKIHLAHLLCSLLDPQIEETTWLLAEFSRFTPPEKHLVFDRLVALADQGSEPSRDLLCRLAMLHDLQEARQICAKKGYLPSDTSSQATFLFLTEQWQAYENLDFSYQWLTAAYQAADPSLKQKILSRSRSTGKIEWLQNIAHARTAVSLSDLTPRDWKTILDVVSTSQSGDQIKVLLQYAPPYWCVQILHILSNESPAHPSRISLEGLIDAARLCFGQMPEIAPLEFLQSPGRGIFTTALSPDGQELIVGGSDAVLHFWNFSLRFWQPELVSPVANTRVIAYSPDGEFFTTASGDHRIRIYRASNRTLLKTLSIHSSQIKSLAFQSDSRVLFSAGLDGLICAWHFPSGMPAYSPVDTGTELFGLALTGKDRLLVSGGANRLCQVRASHNGALLQSIAGFEDTILTLAADPAEWVALGTRDKLLHLINPSSGKPVLPAVPVPDGINQLLFHPSGNWLFSLDLRGRLVVWYAATLEKAFELSRHAQPGSGLVLSTDGQTLISASTDGKIIFWDLRVVNRVFRTASQDSPAEIGAIDEINKSFVFSPMNKYWLGFLLDLFRWRARFDILIDEPQVLEVGEFDILL